MTIPGLFDRCFELKATFRVRQSERNQEADYLNGVPWKIEGSGSEVLKFIHAHPDSNFSGQLAIQSLCPGKNIHEEPGFKEELASFSLFSLEEYVEKANRQEFWKRLAKQEFQG